MITPEMLARENAGAIEVDEPTIKPVMVFLAGPIKHWWSPGMWDSPEHREYVIWRDAVEAYLVKNGYLVYSPHRAWRGAWWESAQKVNNEAIRQADVLVDLTPPGVPANGTAEEIIHARRCRKAVVSLPPGTIKSLESLARIL